LSAVESSSSASQPVKAKAHWTSAIGTGRASESTARRESSVTVSRTQP
jgi:hypothetical protein